MEILHAKGLVEPLKAYLAAGKPFLGICLGMQLLFEGSEESPGVEGLGVIPGQVTHSLYRYIPLVESSGAFRGRGSGFD
jgi:imidazoleglycerol phosphate synthase glutamine amidotransferase subunit HisH